MARKRKPISEAQRKKNLFEIRHGVGGLKPEELKLSGLEYKPSEDKSPLSPTEVPALDIREHFRKPLSKYNLSEEQLDIAYGIIEEHLNSDEGMHIRTTVQTILKELWGEDGSAFRSEKAMGSSQKSGLKQKVKGMLYGDMQTLVRKMATKKLVKKTISKKGKTFVLPVRQWPKG